ncbi:MAG: hypothetical protein HQ473_07775, partial [Cryomorphaceae bacterium]|nr:hypothetical protein [Cryomorphaceae bacterium]
MNDGAAAIDLLVSANVTGGNGSSVERDGAGFMRLGNSFAMESLTLFDGQTEVTGTVDARVFLDGGSLSGTGVVGALASQVAGGDRAPGAPSSAAGQLMVNGAITLGGRLTFSAGLTSPATPGVSYDQLKVTGTVDVGGATLALSEPAGFTALHGDRFVLIDNDAADAITGTFAGLPEGTLIALGSHRFLISYLGGDGNDVEVTFLVAATGVTRTWDGGGGADINWTTATNWDGDVAPVQGDAAGLWLRKNSRAAHRLPRRHRVGPRLGR